MASREGFSSEQGPLIPFDPAVGVRHIEAPIDEGRFVAWERAFRPFVEERDGLYKAIPGSETWPSFEPSREKLLEYFLSLEALGLEAGSVYMDVASCLSLFPNFVAETTKAEVIRQDLLYTPGAHEVAFPRVLKKGWRRGAISMRCIGCDACSVPLPEASVDAIGLHCSFEHFEGDADGRFAREAYRVLRPGGRLLIIPFYCGNQGVEIYKEDFASGCQFHRYYDPPMFVSRVLAPLPAPMRPEIRYYRNVNEIDADFYCVYSICLLKA